MFVEALQRHLVVCGHAELDEQLMAAPGDWSVVSIREPHHPLPELQNARRFCELIFLDMESKIAGLQWPLPGPAHLEKIFRFADAEPEAPLLIHCWAGRSRSTGVALALITRGLWQRDIVGQALVTQAVDILLALRPYASPNTLVLRYGLDLFLPAKLPETLSWEFKNEPRLMQNRTGFLPG
jgi:predicted protein tyrosine phosphatase